MTEEWLPVVGYEGLYSVSNHGKIRSEPRLVNIRNGHLRTVPAKILAITPPMKHEKYPTVSLWRNNFLKRHRVHNLVARAFLGPRPLDHQVLHWDDNPTNNSITNLRYGTHQENKSDAIRNSLTCRAGHVWSPENTYIRPDTGRRQCRQCRRERKAAWVSRNPKSPIQCGGKE